MLCKTCCVYSTGVFSILLLLLGISLSLVNVFPKLMDSMVKQQVVLKNGTESYKAWESPPPPVYMQFYFFNLTNSLEVMDGERPAVVEMGPYTYREYRPMEQVTFLDNGTKVAAVNTKTYIFQLDMSRGPESDLIRTINIPVVTVMEQFKNVPFIPRLISDYMRETGAELFTTRTVGELLWGYEDALLKALKVIQPSLDDVFGLFYKANATNDGDYVFFTGQDNYKDFARVDTWNGESSVKWWITDDCNMVNGTNGAAFHPVISRDERLYMFSSDLCRSLYSQYVEDLYVKGIPAYRFVPPSKVFANSTVNPDNAGFCVPAGNCLGSGLLNVSPCKQGAPIIMSSPHFYQADEKFVMDVFGMNPEKEQHQTTIDLHPLTGLVLQAAKRMQINVFMEQISSFASQTRKVRTVVLPVVYLNESVIIDDESAKKLQLIVFEQQVVVHIPFMVIGLGVLLGLIFMVLICRQKTPESSATERQPLLTS